MRPVVPALVAAAALSLVAAGASAVQHEPAGSRITVHPHEGPGARDVKVHHHTARLSAFSPKDINLTKVTYTYAPASGLFTATLHVADLRRPARKNPGGHHTYQSVELDVIDGPDYAARNPGAILTVSTHRSHRLLTGGSFRSLCLRDARKGTGNIDYSSNTVTITFPAAGCFPAGTSVHVYGDADQYVIYPHRNVIFPIADDYTQTARFAIPATTE